MFCKSGTWNNTNWTITRLRNINNSLTSAVRMLHGERGQRDADPNGWVLKVVDSRSGVRCSEVCLVADLNPCRCHSRQPDRNWITDAVCRAVSGRHDCFRWTPSVDVNMAAGHAWRHLYYKVNNDSVLPIETVLSFDTCTKVAYVKYLMYCVIK